MSSIQILVEEKYKGKVSTSLVADLYDEVSYANPVTTKGMRGAVVRKSISGINLVIRMYRRGGIARFFLNNLFFKSPFLELKKTRPFREFSVLKSLAGLPVPSPVAVCVKFNKLSYSGIIITKEIPLSQSLLEVLPDDLSFIKSCAQKAGKIARAIVEKGIYHPDLHLGNVLYQSNGEVFIIDFDRSSVLKTSEQKKKALKKISKRWSRSVKKWMGDQPAIITALDRPFVDSLNSVTSNSERSNK